MTAHLTLGQAGERTAPGPWCALPASSFAAAGYRDDQRPRAKPYEEAAVTRSPTESGLRRPRPTCMHAATHTQPEKGIAIMAKHRAAALASQAAQAFLDLYSFLCPLRDARQRRQRASSVTVRLSGDEKATLAAAADLAGMPLAAYFSQAASSAATKPAARSARPSP